MGVMIENSAWLLRCSHSVSEPAIPALSKSTDSSTASLRFAPLKFASLAKAPNKLAPVKFDDEKLVPLKSAL